VRDDRKEQGGPVEGDQVPTSAGFGERKFFEFASKNAVFYAFWRKIILVARIRDQGA